MFIPKNFKKASLAFLALFIAAGAIAIGLQASMRSISSETILEIDGMSFGKFDLGQIGKTATKISGADGSVFTTLTFSRDFVTDRSLYLWAKESAETRSKPVNLHLISVTEDGKEIQRRILPMCQPLSWSLASTSSDALGGYQETVEISIQGSDFL